MQARLSARGPRFFFDGPLVGPRRGAYLPLAFRMNDEEIFQTMVSSDSILVVNVEEETDGVELFGAIQKV
jgi:hypothetical protein